ncbi:SDR family oxidoreductase [Devosia sp. Root105]|uniref:SDR family oxidoreductase n=1 Tax=Devosia sp. Root105 TaxID=1736423 RepID=UPI0006F864E0|nr:SDR family oxidoreductase [Devosia sp. Root105]KQU96647.1 hypothetical protein ASC68_14880 [Devosia sp. Root105]
MHFLVLGAGGFIGRHIVAKLLESGHRVTAAARSPAMVARTFPSAEAIRLDLIESLPSDVASRLAGVDVIVNAAGQLSGPDLERVHVAGPEALYRAAAAAGIARIILISAISAREDVDTPYSATKLRGEAVLRQSSVPWTILRPSMVVAKGSFGGSSLLRGVAGSPLVTPVIAIGDGSFSPIHARDLAQTVLRVATDQSFANRTLEPAGPDTLRLPELVRAYRRWLGLSPAPELAIPAPFAWAAARLGDWFGGGPLSTTTLRQLAAGNAADGTGFAAAIGFSPMSLATMLEREPADVQDRWHSRLFLLGIAAKLSLIFIWLASAVAGLLSGQQMAASFVASLGLPAAVAQPLVLVTCLLDLVAAGLLLFERRGRWALALQLALVLGYTAGLTLVMPGLWGDPFGPLVKNIPILALIMINAVLSDSR